MSASGNNLRLRVGLYFLLALGLAVPGNNAARQTVVKAIGLEVGEKAPAFSASDQFGHEQDNRTLRGSNGTVLLLFRSADW